MSTERDVIVECLTLMRQALERLPAERADAERERNVVLRNYRNGLCDGVEETIDALSACFRPLTSLVES